MAEVDLITEAAIRLRAIFCGLVRKLGDGLNVLATEVEIFLSLDSGYLGQVLVGSRGSNPELVVLILSRENVQLGRICTRVAQKAQFSRDHTVRVENCH